MKYITMVNDEVFEIELDNDREIIVNGERYTIDFEYLNDGGMLSLLLNHRSLEAVVNERDDVWDVLTRGELYSVQVQDERAYRLARTRGGSLGDSGETTVKSPMPGLIVAVSVSEGDAVQKGDKVIILESMKMENELRSPLDGVIGRINVSPGDSVEKDQVLVVIVDPDGDEE
ncbi:MAG: biotin/lipoyl-binding protein [Chloroflexi bacterium]|nr:biotin/lipoyl-binding protein [Chloroflexota bacterium]